MSKEVDYGVVVADDEKWWAERTAGAWKEALTKEGVNSGIKVVSGYQELLKSIKMTPALIVLDHKYEENYRLWRPEEVELENLAREMGVDFNPIKKPDRGGWIVSDMPDGLYHPNSVNFGLLLRYFGFTGKIVVVSSDPPEPDYITRELTDLNTHLGSFDLEVSDPIDAVVCKPSRYHPNQFQYATQRRASTQGEIWWDYQQIEGEDFSVAIGQLLRTLL